MRVLILLAIAVALSVGGAPAQDAAEGGADLSSVIRLPDLVDHARRVNPEIRAAEQKLRAAEARPSQRGSLPDPTVTVGYRNDGFDRLTLGDEIMSQASLALTQEVPFPGKLRLREEIASFEAAEERARLRATTLGVIARLKVAFRELLFVHQSIDVVRRSKAILEKFEKSVEARYQTGQGIQQDVLKAQVEISKLVDRLVDLEQKKASAEAELNGILNRPADALLGTPQSIPESPTPPGLEGLIELAEKHSPMLEEAAKTVRRGESALSLARREYLPDFMLMGGYMNRESLPGMWETQLGVKLPLYFWRKQRYGVTEAVETLGQARDGRQNARQMVLARVRDLHATATRARELVDLYRAGIIPQATLALESAAAGYQVGRVDFLTYLDNFVTLLDYELRYREEAANLGKAAARLEETVGMELEK
ncbi:MAG: TolC family protein [Deltaproteobacteria bacterium]|nr:TolC family protein [Deltaproteobacteria bacterium]